jgi:hypothetical protein
MVSFLCKSHSHPSLLFIFFSIAYLFLKDAQTKMARDEWVRVAMTDDAVVVELLVGLKQLQAVVAAAGVVVVHALAQVVA